MFKKLIIIFLQLATTGIRRKELIGIRLDDIDFTNNTIYISNPKGNKKHRTVLLAPMVKEYMQKYLIVRKERVLNDSIDTLLIGERGKACSTQTISQIVLRLSKKYGVKFSLHSFRRGLATELYNKNNAGLLEIADVLGHSNPNTTIRHYIKCDVNRTYNILKNHQLYKQDANDDIKSKAINFNTLVKMYNQKKIQKL